MRRFNGTFWNNSSKKGQEGFLPYVKLMNEQNVEISGLALFNRDKMAGITKPLEIGAYMGIKGQNPAGYRGIVRMGGGAVTLYATHRISKIDVRIQYGLPHFSVSIMNELNIEEKVNEQFHIDNAEILKEIERVDERLALKLHERLIEKTQEKGSDIFGFGDIRAQRPRYWNREIKTKERWQEVYKSIPIDIKLDVKIRRIGTKAK